MPWETDRGRVGACCVKVQRQKVRYGIYDSIWLRMHNYSNALLGLFPITACPSIVTRTWWTLETWPFASARLWCRPRTFWTRFHVRRMSTRSSRPSSFTMKPSSLTPKSWRDPFMRSAWAILSTGECLTVYQYYYWHGLKCTACWKSFCVLYPQSESPYSEPGAFEEGEQDGGTETQTSEEGN